jgi:tripartite ATP-independent transporter DctM subunit
VSSSSIGILSIVCVLVLIQGGMPIAIALLLISLVSIWILTSSITVAGNLVVLAVSDSISNYNYAVVPLFMLMGLLISVSDIGRDAFQVASQLFRRVIGGVGIATVAANALFAAVTGTSIASAAVFTRIAVPELTRLGYTNRFAVGVVAGTSVLGMLIPPSFLMIVFGIIAEVSIGDLFTAGILPGLLLAFAYVLLIICLSYFWTGYIGAGARRSHANDGEIPSMSPIELVKCATPITALAGIVLGGIYGGFFTPTEAAAAGTLGALILAIAKGRLTLKKFWSVLAQAGHATAAISIILISAHTYSRMLAMSGLPNAIGQAAVDSGLGVDSLIVLYLIGVLLLGTILDAVAIMLILVPLILPTLVQHHVDLVWFGIISIIAIEVGLLTPPLGLSAFVVKSNLEDKSIRLGDIFKGAFPFTLMMIVVLALIFLLPGIATILV